MAVGIRSSMWTHCVFLIVVVFCYGGVVQGCYAPFHVPIGGAQANIGVVNDKIIFAGGTVGNVAVNQVYIYDTITREVANIGLPTGRRKIVVTGFGSKILFAGGISPSYPFIDILNLDTMNITSFPLPINSAITGSVVVGSEAFFYASSELFSLHMETNVMRVITTPGILNSAATDGSSIFFLLNNQRKIQKFYPHLATWTSLHDLTETYIALFINQQGALIAYGASQMMIFQDSRGVLRDFSEFRTGSNILPVMSGNFIYVANQRTMIMHDTREGTSFRYRMSNAFYTGDFSAAVHNGTIYYSGSGVQVTQVLTVNTRAFLQPYISNGQLQPYFDRGTLFWFTPAANQLVTYDLDQRESATIEWTMPRSLETSLPVTNKLLTVSETAYDTYDHETRQLTSRGLPPQVPPLNFAWSHSSGDYAAFILRNNTLGIACLYNGLNDTWTTLSIDAPRRNYHRVRVVNDKVLFISGRTPAFMEVYDPKEHRWIDSFNLGTISLHLFFTTVGPTFVLFAGQRNESTSLVHMYNTANRVYSKHYLQKARSNIIVNSVDDKWVIFSGGFTTANILSTRVDLYDVQNDYWTSAELPPVPPEFRSLITTNSRNLVFFGRSSSRVDVLDLDNLSRSAQEVPHTFSGLFDMMPLGSKVLFFGQGTGMIEIGIYETSTQTMQTIELGGSLLFFGERVWRNFLDLGFANSRYIMPLSAIFAAPESHETFSSLATNFSVDALGYDLTYSWRHNGRLLNRSEATLFIPNVQRESEGNYQVQIIDQCSERMAQQAKLTVNGPPVIDWPLHNMILLCHETRDLEVSAHGKQLSFSWAVGDDRLVSANMSKLTIANDSLACNSDNRVCATVYNPAGQDSSCATVRFLEVDRIFEGPLSMSNLKMHLIGSSVELKINVKEKWCMSHTWYADGKELDEFGGSSSKVSIKVSRGMENTRFYVVAQCGDNRINSRAFTFEQIIPLEDWELALIIIFGVIGIAGVVVGAIFLTRKLRQSGKKEVELQDMLTQAKTESLKKDSLSIIKATVWEWTPTEDFAYKSLDSLPCSVDTTLLQFGDNNLLDVDMVSQSDIVFSLNDSKLKKHLKQPLLNGLTVDIYAPKSPKYEISIEPSSFELSPNSSVHVAVSVKLRMTTKCKVTLVVVLEQRKIYSAIEFKLSSKMSTWLDLEEIQMSGEFLGGGGFGSVTRGVYRGQDVAVKKLLSQYLTPDMMIEFEREVTLMKSLRHPNIVQFIGASNVKESLAIVIEFAPLGSLASVMEKQQVSLQFKVTCLLETAKALQFLHSNGVIHRDIKPQNILVFSLEQRSPVHVKLTDFGTSRFISDDPTTITKNVGTIAFMAPEALGRNPRIDKSADVYSFAVLMWAVLFEQTPFKEFKWDSDIEQHVKSGNRLPFPHGHAVQPSLVKLIENCWQQEPKERPSMSAVVQQLSSIQVT